MQGTSNINKEFLCRLQESRAAAENSPSLFSPVSRLSRFSHFIALEQFRNKNGRLPQKLEELAPAFLAEVPKDPFTGSELLYHPLPNGYVIYSVGRDLIDDGGKEEPDSTKARFESTYDITFIVER